MELFKKEKIQNDGVFFQNCPFLEDHPRPSIQANFSLFIYNRRDIFFRKRGTLLSEKFKMADLFKMSEILFFLTA
jgi:hypothetical protein